MILILIFAEAWNGGGMFRKFFQNDLTLQVGEVFKIQTQNDF